MTQIFNWQKIITMLLVGLLFSPTGFGASLHRCGNSYQDRPCANAPESKKLIGGMHSAASSSTVTDASCARRGESAKKIVWAREAGAMLEQQLAKARGANERQLINEVYGKRGTSTDVSAEIEKDCIASKENVVRGAQPAAGETYKEPQQSNNQDSPKNAADTNLVKKPSAREVAQKKIRCDHMQSQIDTVTSQQRAGGSARVMDDLNQTRRHVESRMSAEECPR